MVTMPDELSPHELLLDIEHKDRKFRLAQRFFMILVTVVLAGILVALFVQNQSLKDQATRSDDATQKILENQKNTIDEQRKQIETTNRYIQCLARFFATTDSDSRVLTNLERCNITSSGSPVTGLNLTPSQNQSTAPSSGSNSSGNTGTSNPGSSGGNGGDGNNGSGNNNDNKPLCVPPIGVCVEN